MCGRQVKAGGGKAVVNMKSSELPEDVWMVRRTIRTILLASNMFLVKISTSIGPINVAVPVKRDNFSQSRWLER